MENHLSSIEMIQMMGVLAGALRPDLKFPMIATRDIGAYAAERLLKLDFSGKQMQELHGERDLSMTEAAAIISRGISKPDLRYLQFTYEQVEQALVPMGVSAKTAGSFIEMFQGMNNGIVAGLEARGAGEKEPAALGGVVRGGVWPAGQGGAGGGRVED